MLYAFGFIGSSHRRPDGPFPRGHRSRRPRARHVLRRRALPLHHGRRHADGVPGRPCTTGGRRSPGAVSGGLGQAERLLVFSGFNLTFLRSSSSDTWGCPGGITCIPRVPGAQRDVHGGATILASATSSDGVPDLVVEARAGGRRQPVQSEGPRVETTSPAPTFNFDRTPIVTEATHSYAHHTEVKVA